MMLFLTATTPPVLDVWDICLRLLCAMMVGMVIGTEREYTNRPAGMRTHILVALGACSVMITGQMIFQQYSAYGASSDPARLSAQVITGVGFLGAGTILREGANVKGLTTAASLWAVACLGIAAGGGYFTVALIGMGFIFATLTIFEVLQHKLIGPGGGVQHYILQANQLPEGLAAIRKQARDCRCDIHDMEVIHNGNSYTIAFSGEFTGIRARKRSRKFLERLGQSDFVQSVKVTSEDIAIK